MNVFLPIASLKNTFLDEIEKEFNGSFIYDHYRNIYKYDVDIINLHWPDSVFSNNKYEYEDFKNWLQEVQKKVPLVYSRHNTVSHTVKNDKALAFNDYINTACDAVHHYGNFSFNEHKNKYPNYKGKHAIIPHPLYKSLENTISRKEAREILGIPQNAKTILVFGVLRSNVERKLVLNLFKRIRTKNKFLLVPNFGYIQPPEFIKNRRLRNAWSKMRTLSMRKKKNMKLGKSFIEEKDIQLYFNSADMVFIPRTNSLNSGIVFLAYTFGKNVVAPKSGNITENILENSQLYIPEDFDSIILATQKLLESPKTSNLNYQKFEPKVIAKRMENFFEDIIRSKNQGL